MKFLCFKFVVVTMSLVYLIMSVSYMNHPVTPVYLLSNLSESGNFDDTDGIISAIDSKAEDSMNKTTTRSKAQGSHLANKTLNRSDDDPRGASIHRRLLRLTFSNTPTAPQRTPANSQNYTPPGINF
ncbi:hypothetical protein AKJ16_DCAP03989 [Drosera capensis]